MIGLFYTLFCGHFLLTLYNNFSLYNNNNSNILYLIKIYSILCINVIKWSLLKNKPCRQY